MRHTNDRAEIQAMRQLPPQAVAHVLGLQANADAARRHGGAGYSYWSLPSGALVTVRQGRAGWVWALTKRDGPAAGGDWLALAQHLNPSANLGKARRILRPALGASHTAPPVASQPLLAPRAEVTTMEPPQALQLCEPPTWTVDYLQRDRGVPAETIEYALALRAIAGHRPGYRTDQDAVHLAFPHSLRDGLQAHAELRGPADADGLRSKRASRGTKGLWVLPPVTQSSVVVVVEGAIKGLAVHARLAQAGKPAWIVSTGGSPGQAQLDQLRWLVQELEIKTLALAHDRDAAGDQQAARCAGVAPAIKAVRMAPPTGCKGWDDWAMTLRDKAG